MSRSGRADDAAAERIDHGADFSAIARKYALMKSLLSAGQEVRWKTALFRRFVPDPPHRWLDVATGTGDFFHMASSRRLMIGLDRNRDMLRIAGRGLPDSGVHWVAGDLNRLPFRPASVDLITIGYGLRYSTSLPTTASACFAALGPGGAVFVFDIGHPVPPLRPLWYAYLFVVGTILGALLHARPTTYWHLWQTLRRFPGQDEVRAVFESAGFAKTARVNVMGGAMFALYAEKSR